MTPILNVELGDTLVKLQVENLSSGLRGAVTHFDPAVQNLVAPYLEELTVDSMTKLRESLPGLRVTAHYLVLQDSAILDAS